MTVGFGALALGIAVPEAMGRGLDRVVRRWDLGPAWGDATWIAFASAFLLTPLLALLLRGLPAVIGLPASVWIAAGHSIWVAVVSTIACTGTALAIAVAAARLRRGRSIELAGMLGLAASPLVLGTGLFIVVYPFARPDMASYGQHF